MAREITALYPWPESDLLSNLSMLFAPFPPCCPSSIGLLHASDGGHAAPPHSGSGVPVPAAPGTGLWGRKACPAGADSHSAGKERPTQRSTTNVIISHSPIDRLPLFGSFQNPA